MIKTELIGPEDFIECLGEAMRWYGVYKSGFDQKDLLPTEVVPKNRTVV